MDHLDELIKDFCIESYENLDQLDQDFIALESDPTAKDKISSIFRTIHTIKGTCGCLGMHKLEAVAHVGENLLVRIRDGKLLMDSEMTTGLLRLVDAIRQILASLETTSQEGNGDYSDVIAHLVRLNETPDLGSAKPAAAVTPVVQAPEPALPVEATPPPVAPAIVEPVVVEPPVASEAVKEKDKAADSLASNGVRVDVTLLDRLMNLVGELVLTRNQILQCKVGQNDAAFMRTAQQLNLITAELQEGVMKTRMQPIGNLWNKFPRIVRDVAATCGKKVNVEMDGRETELDKTILEAIKDPLTHVIRNSVDHGVETPEQRVAAGKPEEGRLYMRAFHEGGQVNIEIVDDGKGINPDIVKRKAQQKGLITAEQAARMTEREAINLIFLPGFSTAEKVTNVSGRGVGMDVVKTNVEKIGGTVDVTSQVGQGTTLRIKIPLTLAIIPALLITSGGERFAIPQVSVLELVRLENSAASIEMVNNVALYRLRGNLLPLIYLNRELQLRPAEQSSSNASANIVVLQCGERQVGMVVDHINDTEEIVVKPLSKQLKTINVLAGATIMGDGKVALILDVTGLAQRARVVSQSNESGLRIVGEKARTQDADAQTLLLFEVGGGQTVGLPLAMVDRLEEFPRTKLEQAGDRPVIQYRQQVMPVINVTELLHPPRQQRRPNRSRRTADASDMLQVIVHSHEGSYVGLRVEKILDVVSERVQMQPGSQGPGVLGTAIIRSKVTSLLDVPTIVSGSVATAVSPELQEAA